MIAHCRKVLLTQALALGLAMPALAQPASAPAAAAASASGLIDPPLSGPARCRFATPNGWDARQVRWTGDCHAGLAQGLGTLRAIKGKQVLQVFYGSLKNGQPVLGVIEQTGGYRAGRFERGALVNDGERNTLIQAFEEASAAARQVAQRHQAGGNPASARFYRQKASVLAQQMD